MEIRRDSAGAVNVARLRGRLDSTTAETVHEQIGPVLMAGRPVLLDFTGVPCVSDAGLRTMLMIYRQAQAVDGKVAVVGLSHELRSALAATGYLRFFCVADDVTSGIRALLDDLEPGDLEPQAVRS